ncbi:MAG: SPOR domain-containing protein [Rhizobiaceae bacterium]|nr:SPOR domain-containing protein [Rhizobiaceae bacterium]
MSERIDQASQSNPIEDDDPLAELARIVAGESPIVEALQEQPVEELLQAQHSDVAVPEMQGEAEIEFGADLEQELLREIAQQQGAPIEQQPVVQGVAPVEDLSVADNPVAQPSIVQAPIAYEPVVQAPVSHDPIARDPSVQDPVVQAPIEEYNTVISDFEASLEEQLVSELQVQELAELVEPAAPPLPSAPVVPESQVPPELPKALAESFVPADAERNHIEQLQQVEALAGELAVEAMPDAGVPQQENYVAPQELTFDIEPELATEADFSGDELNLEAEFESAFADELDLDEGLQQPVDNTHEDPALDETPPAQSWDEIDASEGQLEFDAAFPEEEENIVAAVSMEAGPEHLNDPAMFDEAELEKELGASMSPRSGRSGFKMAALALGIALVAGFSAVGYGYFSKGDSEKDPIVVKADTGDIKIKPENRGGKFIANQDKASYAELSGEKENSNQDRLISGTEIANETPERVASFETKVEERLSPGTDEPVANVPAAIAPKRVKTFTVKPDGTIIIPDPVGDVETTEIALQDVVPNGLNTFSTDPVVPEALSLDPNPENGTDTTQLASANPVVETTNSGPEPIDGAVVATGNIPIPEQSPLPKPVLVSTNPEPANTVLKPDPEKTDSIRVANTSNGSGLPLQSASSSNGWAVQISSQRSQEAADASFKNLKRKFPNLLNDQSVSIQQAQVSGKGTFFRVRVKAQSKQSANSFCTKFKSSGGSCFVTR